MECGRCAQVCPYSAIVNHKRPCENACKIKAISMDEDSAAKIDNNNCISCGACVYQCPFGAIMDKSFILDVIDLIKKSENNTKYKLYAVVAPSISSQFSYAKLGQVITGIQELGFFQVVEAALGADMVAYEECKELAEKGFLDQFLLPGVCGLHREEVPAAGGAYLPQPVPGGHHRQVYQGHRPQAPRWSLSDPAPPKRWSSRRSACRPYIDSAITFEELQALFDSRDIDIEALEEDVLDNASYYGRIFARSGGLSDAVRRGAEGAGTTLTSRPVPCDGIEACRVALLKASKERARRELYRGHGLRGRLHRRRRLPDPWGEEQGRCGQVRHGGL